MKWGIKMKFRKMIKTVLAVSILTSLCMGVTACGSSSKSAKDTTESKDTLILGFDDTFVPMGFKDDNGEYTGFDIELAKAVADKMGKTLEFQPIDWTMKESELNNGNIDMIWNGYSVTDERKEKVNFSKSYLESRQIIITLKDSTIKTKEDLKGKTVAAQDQSSAIDAIGDYKNNFKSLVTFETNDEALRDLEAGRCDAVVADEVLSRYYIKIKGEDKYNILNDNFGEEEYAVGVRKDDTKFLDKLNSAYDEVVADGTASKISEKWFGKDIILK